jgi:hypothetical protein
MSEGRSEHGLCRDTIVDWISSCRERLLRDVRNLRLHDSGTPGRSLEPWLERFAEATSRLAIAESFLHAQHAVESRQQRLPSPPSTPPSTNLSGEGLATFLDSDDFGRSFGARRQPTGGDEPGQQPGVRIGPLFDQISNADGANLLINPIDGSPILLDVYGNPRTSNGLRSIGAVQPANVPSPLPFAGAAAALTWSRRLRRRMQPAQTRQG